ncbi:MAG: PocR ligand-binding domain-containing protein, partial [Smithella sp.]
MKDRVFQSVNRAWVETFGYSESEIIGQTPRMLYENEKEYERVARELYADLPKRSPASIQTVNKRKNGEIRHIILTATPLHLDDLSSKIKTTLVTVEDITERKRAEDALQESEKQVRRKLNAILSPEGDIGALELSDIINTEKIQKLMDEFYCLTHIGIGIIDLQGRVLVGTGWQDICTNFHRADPESCRLCMESDLELTSCVRAGTFKKYRCKNNMWDIATPIMLGDRHVGNIFLGQFLFDDEVPDLNTYREQARRFGFNEQEYIEALDRVPRWSRETVHTTITFYAALAELIGNLSYSNIKLARALEERKLAEEALRESEERFNLSMEATNDGLWDWNIKNDKGYFSPGYYRMLGYEVGGFSSSGSAWKELIHSEDFKHVMQANIDCIKGRKEHFEIEYRMKARNGEWRWILGRGKCVVRNEKGYATRLVGTHVDITDRKRAEEELQRRESLIRSVNNNLPSGMIYQVIAKSDGTRRFSYLSDSVRQLHGISPEEGMADSSLIYDRVYEIDKEFLMEAESEALRTISPFKVEIRMKDSSGGIRWSYISSSPSLMRDGSVCFDGIELIITDRKRTEEALEKRIVALTRPLQDTSNIEFEDLFNLSDLQQIQDMLAYSWGVAILLTRPDGTAITKPSNFTYLCNNLIRKNINGFVNCKKSDAVIGKYNPTGPTICKCLSAGLWQAGASITLEGRHIANWLIGQIRNEAQNEEQVIKYANIISIDRDIFREAFLKVPIMSQEKFELIAYALFALANQLSAIAYQNIQQARFITEQKQAEKALRESEIKYRRLHESMREAFASVDMSGHILETNRAFQTMLGYSEEELCQLTYEDLTPGKWHEFERSIIENQVLIQGHSEVYEKEYRRKDGTIFPVELRAFLLPEDTGKNAGMWAIVRDISERKRAEKTLEEQKMQLENANKELESFSYSISHDLRAPLRAIDGFSRMILKKQGANFDKDTLSKFNVIRRNTEMMGQQIDGLLELSRLGQKSMVMSLIEIKNLIQEVWEEIEVINPNRKMSISIKPSPQASGDRQLLRLVYSNLLSNAVKFTKNRDIALIEAGGFTDRGKQSVYYVKDNGAGFDMKHVDKLFGVFQRLHSAEEFEGTGIGLATIQRIINKHGGRVWAEGKVDNGAIFYFSLPASSRIQVL